MNEAGLFTMHILDILKYMFPCHTSLPRLLHKESYFQLNLTRALYPKSFIDGHLIRNQI